MKHWKRVDQRVVLVLNNRRVTERDKERLGVYCFEKKDWEVITWNLGDLLGKNNASNYAVFTKDILQNRFDITLDNALSTRTSGYYWKKIYLLILLKLRTKRVIFDCGLLPEIREQKSCRMRLRSLLANPIQIVLDVPWMLLRANAYVAGGDHQRKGMFYKHKIIGNSYDFDRYLEEDKQGKTAHQTNDIHGLYLEQGLHDCMDCRLVKRPYPIDRDIMIREIANGLTELCEKTAIRIDVKKHPRTDRGDLALIGLKEDKQQTTYAVRESSFVIAHYTTAISFAVIYRKPIIFWITKEQLKAKNDPYVSNGIGIGCEMAKLLGSKLVVWPDKLADVDIQEALRVDELKYEEYENNYIRCKGALEVTNAERLIEFYTTGFGR